MTEIDIKKACKAGDSSPSVKRKVHHAMYLVVAFMSLCILDIVIVLRVGWGEINTPNYFLLGKLGKLNGDKGDKCQLHGPLGSHVDLTQSYVTNKKTPCNKVHT